MTGGRGLAPSRRAVVAALAGSCIAAIAPGCDLAAAEPIPEAPVPFRVPHGACDSHVHVIDPEHFPLSPERSATPPPATVGQLSKLLQSLGLDRVVIVTPDAYGTDNSATLAAVERLGPDRARGVGWVDERTPLITLKRMRAAGIVGMRMSFNTAAFDLGRAVGHLDRNFALALESGWHLQIATSPEVVGALAAHLAASPVPIVLDAFGWAEGGLGEPGVDAVLSLLKAGQAYVKLAEPYKLSQNGPDYSDLAPLVRALVAANADRLLWGSGWPYLSNPPPGRDRYAVLPDRPVEAGHLLALFAEWVPNEATRRKILVDNPARLYGF